MSRYKTKIMLMLAISLVTSVSWAKETFDLKKLNMPSEFEQKVKTIPQDKLQILDSSIPTQLLGTMDRFYQAMKTKSTTEIEAYLDAMIEVQQANKFNPETDMASIPLNTKAASFNGWKAERPQNLNPKREPGPIHLSRYMENSRSGVRTFAGAPLAIYPEDLIAGNVDVAIVGAPLDMGSYYRGQRFGPQAMRNEYGAGGVDMNTMVNPSDVLSIVDYGDIAIDNMSTEISVHHVRERVREIAETGAIPFIVGGDHSLEYPDIAGLADVHGKESFGVVHFDAHYDAGKGRTHWITHGQPVYRAVKEGHVKAENFIQVGLRGPWPGAEGFEWMRNNGMRYHTMAEVEKKGWKSVMETALSEAKAGGKKLFISFDVDVLDPAFVPGTGTPVPGGLTMREAIPIIRGLCTENEMVGFEIVELDPLLDPTYRSALNANFIMHACLTGIAMRHEGITEGDYWSELTTEHMQPSAGIKGKKEGKQVVVDPDYIK
ncbi:arginase [Pseudoalteromonas distincta]|uniref:Agmatinase family protein n=1 Tax=Pseudoalteromonas distincta TaxID=77608 RepID=A0ABT9GHA9_9GAMM|nr:MULTISPECIES: agmatinase family protein [Pseudoalteromonas distincta group]KHM50585.1 arginase [Pseudoalteromonas elyakovii]KID33538.1 arginase [Pseudoalteromonas distincta]MDP4485287.1 agmatinase family protein [Pseudoalteromonas elyakovii]